MDELVQIVSQCSKFMASGTSRYPHSSVCSGKSDFAALDDYLLYVQATRRDRLKLHTQTRRDRSGKWQFWSTKTGVLLTFLHLWGQDRLVTDEDIRACESPFYEEILGHANLRIWSLRLLMVVHDTMLIRNIKTIFWCIQWFFASSFSSYVMSN